MALSYLKRGTAAKTATEQADARTAAKKAAAGGVRRFYMRLEDERQITFLDGDFAETGLLDVPCFWEHQVQMNGRWDNWFPCLKEFEPCPVCEDTGKDAAFVYAFTVLNHTPWTDRDGNVHEHEKQLYVCKRDTFKRLSHLAQNRDGLAGCTFDVVRIGDKSANVGSDFDFIEKRKPKEIMKAYGLKEEDTKPFNYDEVFKEFTADDLRQLGFNAGGISGPIGSADTGTIGQDVEAHL